MKRYLVAALVATFAALAALVAIPARSHAAVLDAVGVVGATRLHLANCVSHNAWATMTLSTRAPDIYAHNYTAGRGNDDAWVRWRSVLKDSNGNQVSHGWSDFARAYDDQPAAYSGLQSFEIHNIRPTYQLFMEIQWWSGNTKLGATWNMTDGYTHFSGHANWGRNPHYCGYIN